MSEGQNNLCLVYTPALVAILLRAEKDSVAPLTESDVLTIRDKATCMTVPIDLAAKMEQERGYADIVAEEAWLEWQRVRRELYPEKNYEQ